MLLRDGTSVIIPNQRPDPLINHNHTLPPITQYQILRERDRVEERGRERDRVEERDRERDRVEERDREIEREIEWRREIER